MILGIERATVPVQWGYNRVMDAAQLAIYKAGRSGALDHLVRRNRERELSQIETDIACFAIGKTSEAEEQAIAELSVVKRFAETYGPEDYAQISDIAEAAPPDPFPLKQLERWLDEALPPEPGPVPSPRQGTGHQTYKDYH